VRREEYPIPEKVDEIADLIRDILNGGRVQGLTIVHGDVIRAYRSVQEDAYDPTAELDMALGYAEIWEYCVDEYHTVNDILVGMCKVLASLKNYPICFATGPNSTGLLDRWMLIDELGLPKGVENILGLPVVRIKTLDEDTLLLCGARIPMADLEDIKVVVKTAIDLRGKEYDHYRAVSRNSSRREDAGGVGDDTEGDGASTDQVAATAGESGGLDWVPAGVFGG